VKTRVSVWVGAAIALALCCAPAAAIKGPSGYGKARFGSTVAQVKKLYPGLEELPPEKTLGAPVINGPDIARYVLHNQTYPGVKNPVDVEIRFWKGKLWLYIAYFPVDEGNAVQSKLTADLGAPENPTSEYPSWKLDTVSVLLEKKLGRVTVNENALSKEAQAWFLAELKKGMAGRRPPANAPAQVATPGPTPKR
jgi:hypothetical protein